MECLLTVARDNRASYVRNPQKSFFPTFLSCTLTNVPRGTPLFHGFRAFAKLHQVECVNVDGDVAARDAAGFDEGEHRAEDGAEGVAALGFQ